MGFASKEAIAEARGILLHGSLSQKRQYLRTHPINPPHGYTGMELVKPLGSLFDEPEDPRKVLWSKMKIRDMADMIGFLEFGANERDQLGALTFSVKSARDLPTAVSRAEYIPCWFLPWMSGHIFKLKIASLLTQPELDFGPGIAKMPNPGLFFTAGINGCSVFAVGDPRNPSVYHAGIDPGSGNSLPLLPNETTEQAWRRLLGRKNTTKQIGSIGKTDYISELVNPGGTDDKKRVKYGVGTTTSQAMALQMMLEGRDDITSVQVDPWGCVFGLRDDTTGNWTFTLVKNATIRYYRLIRKKRFLRKDKVLKVGEMMPKQWGPTHRKPSSGLLDLDEVAKLEHTEQIIVTCANLGFQDFFPGAGAAHYRSLGSIQII